MYFVLNRTVETLYKTNSISLHDTYTPPILFTFALMVSKERRKEREWWIALFSLSSYNTATFLPHLILSLSLTEDPCIMGPSEVREREWYKEGQCEKETWKLLTLTEKTDFVEQSFVE